MKTLDMHFILLMQCQFMVIRFIFSKDCDYGYYYNGTSCDDCGIFKEDTNVRIVGGVQAVKDSRPDQVLILQRAYSNKLNLTYIYTCGGTLINRYTVLSAAHCVQYQILINGVSYPITYYSTIESTFTIYIGIYNVSFIYSNKPTDSSLVKNVSKIVIHEGYTVNNYVTFLNDIALFILDVPVSKSDMINIACLPVKSNSYPSYNRTASLAGYGLLAENGQHSDALYNVNLTIYEPFNCKNVYAQEEKNWTSQICAGAIEGGKDACDGDYGGGLMIKENLNGTQKYVVAGIASYGFGCGRRYMAGIYTRTSFYIDWIKAYWKDSEYLTTSKSNFSSTSSNIVSMSSKTTTKYSTSSLWESCQYGYFFNGSRCEECGKINVGYQNEPTTVIVVQYTVTSGTKIYKSYCVGIFINRQTILASQHCLNNQSTESVFIAYIGVRNMSFIYNSNQLELDPTVRSVPVAKIIKHNQFTDSTSSNDITLFLLSAPIKSTIDIACLPKMTDFTQNTSFFNNQTFTSNGWCFPNNQMPFIYNFNLYSITCNNHSSNMDDKICVMNDLNKSVTCQNYESVLLLPSTINGVVKYFVVGILNEQFRASDSTWTYTSIPYYLDWIMSKIQIQTDQSFNYTPSKILINTKFIVGTLINYLIFKFSF